MIKLGQQFGQDLFVRKFAILKAITKIADQLASPHKKDLSFDESALPVQTKNNLVIPPWGGDLLFFGRLANGANLITKTCRFFEPQCCGRLVHPGRQLTHQLGIFPLKQHHRSLDLTLIFVWFNRQRTWAETTLDLVFKTGSGAVAKHRI